jgi:dipeptidyl aminopeptidase/acylaminoacyl peptidase
MNGAGMNILKSGTAMIALLLTAAVTAEPAKRTMTHEDLWTMPRVATPVLSQDGALAVVSVTETDYDPAKTVSDLWLVKTDASTPPRRLTRHSSAESQASFSEDGRQLVFVAKREGDEIAQLYLLDLAQGGEPRRLTQLSTGARLPRFSPDGNQVLFQSDVYPGAANDADNQREAKLRKERKFQVRSYDGFPVRNWDRWLDERQVHIFVVDVASGTVRDVLAGSDLVQQPGFAGRIELNVPTLDPVWSSDGRRIVFVASTNANAAAYAHTNSDLFELDAANGKIRRLTGKDGALDGDSYSKPQFSRDGKRLLALVSPQGRMLYNSTRLETFAWPLDGAPQRTASRELKSIESFAIAPNNRDTYVVVEDAGLLQIEHARPGDKTTESITRLQSGMFTDLQIGGTARAPIAVALYQSATEPPELVRIDLRDGAYQRLTAFTAAKTAELELTPLVHFWSDSPRGVKVHNLLLRPPGFDRNKKYPLLVLMHGGPHNMWRDTFFLRWNYHLLAAPGYVVLMTNYTGSTGFGEGFAQAIQGDPFKTPAAEINSAADAAIAKYGFIDASRQCAGGASYGGHLANWLQGTTTRYRCLISHAGLINLEAQWGTSDTIYSREVGNGGPVWEQAPVWREQNPIRLAAHFKTPTLVSVGEMDFRVPMNNSLEYWSVLQRLQIPSRLLVYPNEDHWIVDAENSRHFYGEIQQWLQRWLQPGVAAP